MILEYRIARFNYRLLIETVTISNYQFVTISDTHCSGPLENKGTKTLDKHTYVVDMKG